MRPAARRARVLGSRTTPASPRGSAAPAKNSPMAPVGRRSAFTQLLIGVLVAHARPQADGSVEESRLSSGSTIRTRSGVIATGVAYRRLDVPGIEQLIGRGVRYGSPSGEALRYTGRRVAVVGGANSAGQAALHLADHASQVTMLVRSDSLERGMSRYLVDRIERHDRIAVRTRTALVDGHGGDRLESVTIEGPEGEQTLADRRRVRPDWRGAADRRRRGLASLRRWRLLRRPGRGSPRGFRPIVVAAPARSALPRVESPRTLHCRRRAPRARSSESASAVGDGAMAASLVHSYLTDLDRRIAPGLTPGRRYLNGGPHPLQDRDSRGRTELKQAACPLNLHSAKSAGEAVPISPGEAQAGAEDQDGVIPLESDE